MMPGYRKTFFPKYSGYLFFAAVVLLSFYYNYHHVLFYRPQGMHQWRQTDCLSFTLNYYRDKNHFFEPSIHFLGSEGTGKTVSEFPVLYYLTAQLWKIFGYHEFILRLVNLLIVFLGLFALFKLAEDILQDSLLALCISFLLFTSPIFVYYSNNFLPNAPALGLTLIGWFFFRKFYGAGKISLLYLTCAFFTMAGLLKVTSAMNLVALVILYLAEVLHVVEFRKGRKIFQNALLQALPFLLAFLLLFAWYVYGYSYNAQYEKGIFLIGAFPVWETSQPEVARIWRGILEHAKWSYYRPVLYGVMLLVAAFGIIYYKKANRFLRMLSVLLALGVFSFMLLFFQFLDQHDYYMIDTLILLPVFLLTFFCTLKESHPRVFHSPLLRLLMIILVVHCADFAARRMRSRYSGWMNETHLTTTKSFEKITPYLRSIGITRDDKVICLPDNSLQITLYLMDQKGWTNFGNLLKWNGIPEKINQGAKYLILYDNTLSTHPYVQPFLKRKVGEFGRVEVFELAGDL